jgi:hypothetical protein
LELLDTPFGPDVVAGELGSAVVVDLTDAPDLIQPSAVEALVTLPVLLIGLIGQPDRPKPTAASLVDVLVTPGDPAVDVMLGCLGAYPNAVISLALLLRASERRTVPDGLVAESAAYSMLQGGPEFARWRASRPAKKRPGGDAPPVRWSHTGTRLNIVLDRPAVHNAYDSAMRDALIDALSIAASDDRLTEVHISGQGPSFCSGGDLDEFGSRPDPATAHLVRLTRNPARLMYRLSRRIVVHLHGSCIGSGIELPAFATRVLAKPDTRISLPEVRLGLIPGAGGTVSLPRRIGRHRTAYLALSGSTIDAPTAVTWGLVDELEND